jgi:hypothetical protein
MSRFETSDEGIRHLYGTGTRDKSPTGRSSQELFEKYLDLKTSQGGAETEVGSETESNVVVRMASHVVAIGIIEPRLVSVG